MSASTLPLPLVVSGSVTQSGRAATVASRPPFEPMRSVRRRPNMQQGRALEALGHAIEYLVDSRMFLVNERATQADGDAVQILSRCSREVFAGCAEVVPVHLRFKQWAAERLLSGALNHAARRV
jgi:hypothetical protein